MRLEDLKMETKNNYYILQYVRCQTSQTYCVAQWSWIGKQCGGLWTGLVDVDAQGTVQAKLLSLLLSYKLSTAADAQVTLACC